MSTPRFTPGPWAVAEFYSTCDEIRPALAVWPAAVLPASTPADAICAVSPLDKVNDADRANAALIAAAPDLYAALRLAVARFAREDINDAETIAMRAALAKAAP